MTDMSSEHTEGLLRIGEVARLFNLSVGTLRHYEQMGLLDPARIDPASGYRYYGSRQLSTLNTISHLRVLDLPLAQIREFVTTRDVDLMQRQLAQQQELIERKRRELERVSRKIDNRLALLHDALSTELDTIYTIDVPELRCTVLRERVNPTDAYALEWQIRQLQKGQHETFVFLGNLGVGINAERLAAGDFDGYDEVFLLLDDTDDYVGDVETRPAARCLTISFRGTHGQAGSRYEQLLGYMHSYIFDAIFAGIHICFSGFFAAYGKSYIGFAHNVLAVALIRVPGAWLLSNAYSDTLFPMGIASPCGSILSAVICVVAFTVLNRRGAFDKLMA